MATQQQNKRYIPVENYSGYSRDVRSKAIISDNRSGYEAFVSKKKEKQDMRDRLDRVESTLDQILAKLEKVDHLK
jgi:hypothetical protein